MEEFELRPGEEVVRNVRTHPFVLGMQLFSFVLLAFVPALIGTFFSFVSGFSPEAGMAFQVPEHLQRFATGVWLLCVWTAAFSHVTRYYLTVWVITSLRIVDIKQYSFFNRQVSSFLLMRVQDMTTEVSGLLGTLIGFGRLSVQTAGSDDDFSMDSIPHPEAVRDIIMSQVTELHHTDDVRSGI